MLTKFQLYIPTTQHTGTIVVPLSDQWYKDCAFDSPWHCGILIQNMKCFVVKTSYLQNLTLKTSFANCWFLVAVDLWTFVISDRRDYHLSILYNTVKSQNWTWVTYISNVLSNKKSLFDCSDSICENTFETSHVRFIHENFSVLITTPLDQIQQNLLRKETFQTTAKPADIVLQTWFEEYPTPP